jgi:hypothetical protein
MPWLPEMRKQLVDVVSRLADREYQLRAWIRGELPPGIYDNFDYAVHFIYDDTCLAEEPHDAIGYYVYDEIEATTIAELVDALDRLFEAQGTDLSDEQYLQVEEWSDVVKAAKMLRQMIARKDAEDPE